MSPLCNHSATVCNCLFLGAVIKFQLDCFEPGALLTGRGDFLISDSDEFYSNMSARNV